MQTNRRSQPLYRDPTDKMLGGVCSGLGHYFDVDTVLVRVGFVVLTLIGGGGALAYAILWAILDPAPSEALMPPESAEPPTVDDTIEAGTTVGETIDAGTSVDDLSETSLEDQQPDELRIDEP